MIDHSSSNTDGGSKHGIIAWLLFPISLFPLLALLTYDWHAIGSLCIPPNPSSNWIGALGYNIAYY